MSFKNKAAILLAAILLTMIGFNAIATPYVEVMKVGKRAGMQVIADMLAKESAARSVVM